MEIRKILAVNLKRHRRAKGYSQEGLAFACEIHRTYIAGVERGVRNPTVTVLAKIARALDIGPISCWPSPTATPEARGIWGGRRNPPTRSYSP
ncbi:MAG: helix-turn-helix transcriptional regulator [Pseudomonadota bacterium]